MLPHILLQFIHLFHKFTHVLIRNSATVQINTPLAIHFEQICMETKYQWDPAGKLMSRTIRICQRMVDFPIIPASLIGINLQIEKLKDSIKFYHDDHIDAIRISMPYKRNILLNKFYSFKLKTKGSRIFFLSRKDMTLN